MMAYWKLVNTHRSEIKTSFLVTKTLSNGTEVGVGEVPGGIHAALIQVANSDLSPGDVVETPEGLFYFQKANWAENN
jgi:hypothetical protein